MGYQALKAYFHGIIFVVCPEHVIVVAYSLRLLFEYLDIRYSCGFALGLFVTKISRYTVLMCNFPPPAFGLDYYTEVMDLSYLLEHLPESSFFLKYKKLNAALIGLVEDYSLISFIPLNVQVHSQNAIYNLLKGYTVGNKFHGILSTINGC